MKKFILAVVCLLLVVLVIPLVAVKLNLFSDESQGKSGENFVIKNTADDRVITLSEKEFLYSTVACEMPISFSDEAIKAQTVAAYTYYSNQKEFSEHDEYDFSCDLSKAYKSYEDLKAMWGDNFEEYYNKLTSCVDSVYPEVITENGKTIVAVYHAISSGMTENSSDIFTTHKDYLISVISPGDTFAPGYNTKFNISVEEFKKKSCEYFPELSFEGKTPAEYIKVISSSKAGSALEAELGNKSVKGTQIRECFGLRSSNFTVSFSDDVFTFDLKGYGHGVGMSQYGAEYMALQGSSYKDILAHYYPNTQIREK